MSEIVERLRETASCADYVVDREIAAEAADTITRLTAEVEKLNSELTDALTDLNTARQDNASFMPILNRLTAENEKLRSLTVVQETLIRKSEAENEKLRAALYDCLETTAKHHAEDQARAQIGGSDMALRKAKAILTRSSLLFGKIRTIVNAALEGKQ